MGFEYVLVDAGWNAAWVPELVDYAAERGVRVLLWTDWHALATPAQRAAAFDQWAAWGVAGVKADFLHSDSGERMAVIDDIAADAAAATCWSASTAARCRAACSATWPNVMTLEGVRGAEHGKSGRADNPAQNVTLAFTRNVIGSMDYTPVTFSAAGPRHERRRPARAVDRLRVRAAALRRQPAQLRHARRGARAAARGPRGLGRHAAARRRARALGDARPALWRALVRRRR